MSEPIENSEQLPVAFVIKNASGNISLVFKNDKTVYDFVGQSFYTHPPIKQSSLAEPVAVRYDFDGYGYQFIDSGSGSDWASRVKDGEFLYTHPQKELTRKDFLEIWDSEVNQCNFIEEHDIANFARAIIKASRGEK